jgi:hypothetical protein
MEQSEMELPESVACAWGQHLNPAQLTTPTQKSVIFPD